MNLFISGILCMLLLEANALTALLSPRRTRVFAGIALLSALLFTNFGRLHGGHLVHPWEQTHFFLGSKYLREVGYFDLYKAVLLADREGRGRLREVRQTRDLHTFDLQPVSFDQRVRAKFSDARWRQFVSDWNELSRWDAPWPDIVSDHGNSGSPAWAVVALPFVRGFGSSRLGQVELGFLDFVLMIVLWILLWRTFGAKAGAIGLTIFSLMPFVFDYLAGSILRWDWLFALGLSMVFWKREKPFWTGVALGYAVVSKLFPICFAAALAWWLIIDSMKNRKAHFALLPLCGGGLISAIFFVGASSLAFGGLGIWREYLARVGVAQHELYYGNQYSLKTVWLQLLGPDGALFPERISQAVDAANTHGLLYVQIAVTLSILAAIAKADSLQAWAAGPLLVLTWLTVNAYYWNMLGLLALTCANRKWTLTALHVSIICFYLHQHFNYRYADCYVFALLLCCTLLVWVGESLSGGGTATASSASEMASSSSRS
jgi:hypothetical protein